MTSLLCVMAILTAPLAQEQAPTVADLDPVKVEHQQPLEPHEIRKAIRSALRDEATSDSFHLRRQAVVRICALYWEMMLNKDFAEFEKDRLQAKLGARLRSVRDDLQKTSGTQPAPSLSPSANGGGAIDERGADELIDLITTTIDPETWEVHGGKGSIFYFSNYRVLVVRQTQDVHAKLGGILGAGP